MLSIVIPYRNEAKLGFTCAAIQRTCNVEYELILVDDGSTHTTVIPNPPKSTLELRNPKPVGNCYSRDRGIEHAKYPIVLVLDAHMNFWDDGWARKMVDYIEANPTHIGCSYSLQLAEGRMEMDKATGIYRGAHLVATDTDSHRRNRVLPCIWNQRGEVGPIGCVLGGAYVFRRDWYWEALQRPWRHLKGWGHSEPVLSLINWLMGGENVLLDVEIGHMYRTGGNAPYSTRVFHMVYNQLFLVNVGVWDEDDLIEMIQHLALGRTADDQSALMALEKSSYRQYRRYLRDNAPRDWWDYKREWMNPNVKY